MPSDADFVQKVIHILGPIRLRSGENARCP